MSLRTRMDGPLDEVAAQALIEEIRGTHTPALDAYRASLPARRTSELITSLTSPDSMADIALAMAGVDEGIDAAATMTEEQERVLAAIGVALMDEIDARIPARSK